MSIASLLSIKVTSPITHMVSSAARGVAASILGVWLFKDVITTYVASLHPISSSLILFLQWPCRLHRNNPLWLYLLHLGEA